MRFSADSLMGVVLVSVLSTACSPASSRLKSSDSQVQPTVIYGSDHRKDVFEEVDPQWREKAESTVALLRKSEIKMTGAGYAIDGISFGHSQGLCKSEPYFDQSVAGFCSGSLIAPDIVLTAGHCVRNESICRNTHFVFGFSYKTAQHNPLQLTLDDVYACKELIHSTVTFTDRMDYALVRLDRPVVGRKPLSLRLQGRIEDQAPLKVIGHPVGLPTKIADGAWVRNNESDVYFIGNLDTYGGNSGSPVFHAQTGVIEGILVRGENDFKFRNGCYVSNVCKDDECRGEDVTRVEHVLKHIDVRELVSEDPEETEAPIQEEPEQEEPVIGSCAS